MEIDYRFAFEMLVDRLTKDNVMDLDDDKIKTIEETAKSCLEDATN